MSTNNLTQLSDDSAANTAPSKEPTNSDSGQQVAHGIDVAPKRRPPQRAGAHIAANGRFNRTAADNPEIQRQVLELAKELWAQGYRGKPKTDVIANRFHISEEAVDDIVIGNGISQECRAEAAIAGCLNAVSMANEAAREALER